MNSMKFTISRVACLLLAVLCVLSLGACGKKNTGLRDLGKTPKEAIFNFVKKNEDMLNEVARYVEAKEGFSYYYFLGTERGASKIEQLNLGQNQREAVKDKTLQKLAKAQYTGEVSHVDSMPDGFVSFRTSLDRNATAFYFVYCADENAFKYITNGFFVNEQSITTQPITGNWYYVEVH